MPQECITHEIRYADKKRMGSKTVRRALETVQYSKVSWHTGDAHSDADEHLRFANRGLMDMPEAEQPIRPGFALAS
jgi:hypothetical protein